MLIRTKVDAARCRGGKKYLKPTASSAFDTYMVSICAWATRCNMSNNVCLWVIQYTIFSCKERRSGWHEIKSIFQCCFILQKVGKILVMEVL